VKGEKETTKQQKYSFELSFSGVVSLFVITALVMVWMFILGILVGRGYRPETVIPQLARVLPQERTHVAAPEPPASAPVPAAERQPTLRAEDLSFHEDLRRPDTGQSRPAAPQPPRTAPPPKPAETPKPAASPAPTPVRADPAPAPAVAVQADKFRYIYQVAAFKEEDRATAFRNQTREKGFSAFYAEQPVNGETWFRVMVTLDGTLEEIERRRAEIEKSVVETPLLRSKNPL
jgi:cell division septation protein DedD